MTPEREYLEAARKAAEVTHVDEGRKEAFIAGVQWCAERFCRMLTPDAMEGMKGYPKALMDELTLKDFRKTLTAFMRAAPVRAPEDLEPPEREFPEEEP